MSTQQTAVRCGSDTNSSSASLINKIEDTIIATHAIKLINMVVQNNINVGKPNALKVFTTELLEYH